MKHRIVIAAILALLVGSVVACSNGNDAKDAGASCSLSTLSGRYDYELHGVRRIEGQQVQYVEVGKETYDGKGNLTNSYTDTDSMQITELTGTYTLGKNCQGVAQYSNGDAFQMWVSPDGGDFSFLIEDAEGREPALSGNEVRTSTDPDATCSTESLKGTYRFTGRGMRQGGVPSVEVGFETFDGAGKVANAYANSNTSDITHKTATYTLGQDCVARIDYGDGDSYTGFVSPDGSRFYWLQTGGVAAGDFFGGLGERFTTSILTGLTTSGTNDAGNICSLSTLSGRYDYELHGVRRIEGQEVQYVEVGKETYDGKGNLTNSYTDTDSMQITELTGTYTLGKNCQGVAQYSNGDAFQMWVSPDGGDFSFLIEDAEGREPALSGNEVRTSTDPDATCSTESLKGTYRYSARGFRRGGVPYVEAGFETFDGAGKVATTYANSNTPEITDTTATYTLGQDCVARIDYGDGDSYTGFVSPDGSRFYWLQTGGAGAGDFFSGLDERLTNSISTGLT